MSTLSEPPPSTHRDRQTRGLSVAHKLTGLIERYPARAFALLSVFYFIAVCGLSYVKLLWLDELITLHIARLGSVHAIWNALAAGADPNPPLTHIAVMLCRKLFGEHALALRLPAVAGYWLGMLSLFLFLKRRIPAVWALAGTVILMSMGGFEWSYESRSYALFYGLAMSALYCWDVASAQDTTATRRSAALVGLTVSLAGGLCANYFAVLAFFPIAFAELVRTAESAWQYPGPSRRAVLKQIDWPIWAVIAISSTPLLLFHPFIQKSVALYAPYAWNAVSVDNAVGGYVFMLDTIRYPLFLLTIFALTVHLLGTIDEEARRKIWPPWLGSLAGARTRTPYNNLLSIPEAAAVSILVAYPFLGYVVASFEGGMLSPRFVIPVCFGFAIAGTLFAYRAFGHLHSAGIIVLLLSLAGFAWRESIVGYQYEVQKESFFRVLGHIPPPDFPGQPLAISDNLLVLPVQHYAPPEIASRIVFPVDFPATMRNRGEASAEVNLWTGRRSIYHFPIVPMATLQQSASSYIILTSGREWLVDDLLRHNYEVNPLLIDTQSFGLESMMSPLSHGRPVFFRAFGDQYTAPSTMPIPFKLSYNLPQSK